MSKIEVTPADIELANKIMIRVHSVLESTLSQMIHRPIEVSHSGLDKLIARHRITALEAQAARIAELEAVLRKIASCEKRADGDVVDIAIKALQETGT